jgi:hypothetical protein
MLAILQYRILCLLVLLSMLGHIKIYKSITFLLFYMGVKHGLHSKGRF